jgi:alpha-beta hydrolase superfamily lysophospholipase
MNVKGFGTLLALIAAGALPAVAQLTELDADGESVVGVQKKSADKQPTITPCMQWIDNSVKPRGALLCVHGLGLHKGTYEAFGERMAKLGWPTYAMDVRGFGSFQSMPGTATRTVDFEGCLQDVRAALEFVHQAHPGLPVFIVGESMGGGIALQATARYPQLVSGLISSVPGAARYHQAADSVKVGFKMLTGAHKNMDVTKIVVDRSTQDQELRDRWLKDDLARFQLSPLELMQFQNFMNDNDRMARKITNTPVLMISGEKDQLVKGKDQQKLIYEIPCKDSVQVYVDYAEHLILEENAFHDDIIQVIDAWLADHAKVGS